MLVTWDSAKSTHSGSSGAYDLVGGGGGSGGVGGSPTGPVMVLALSQVMFPKSGSFPS